MGGAHLFNTLSIMCQIVLECIRQGEFISSDATVVFLIISNSQKYHLIALGKAYLTGHHSEVLLSLRPINH